MILIIQDKMKTINRLFQFTIAIVCLIIFSCMRKDLTIESERKKTLEEIEVSINGAIGWAKNKDFKLLYSIIANDSNYLEVDPGPGLIKGFSQFKRNDSIWGSPDFKAVRYEIRDLTINLAEKGNVAWFYCILDDINEWKGKPACWMNTRWTGVLEKRGKRWIMVQMHFSFAKE
jgi:hypothetical protein